MSRPSRRSVPATQPSGAHRLDPGALVELSLCPILGNLYWLDAGVATGDHGRSLASTGEVRLNSSADTTVWEVDQALPSMSFKMYRRIVCIVLETTTCLLGLSIILGSCTSSDTSVVPHGENLRIEKDEADAVSSEIGSLVMPDLTNTHVDDVYHQLERVSLKPTYRWIASNIVPEGFVESQTPTAGEAISEDTEVTVTVSAGAPAISVSELPTEVRTWLSGHRIDFGDEPVLVIATAAGVAYKTDQLLFGPCGAVKMAYRSFRDASYGDRCY